VYPLSKNEIRIIKLRRMKREGHAAQVGEGEEDYIGYM
jgi:hypothetical protein